METANNETNKKINLRDSAILTLISTTALFVLSFAFNCGYNYYYGIPLMFASTNWFAIVYRIPQIGDIIFLISVAFMFVSFMVNLLKLFKKPKEKGKTINVHLDVLWVIIVNIIFLAIMIFITMKFKTTVFIVVDFMLIVLLIYFTILFFKERKITKFFKKIKLGDSKIDTRDSQIKENSISIDSEFNQHFEQAIKLLDAYPKRKVFTVSISISLTSLVFLLFFTYGVITAINQTSYCFIEENRIVLTTIDTNVIVLSVKLDDSTGKYVNQYKFQILPKENLSFYIVECGRIASPLKFEDRAWSLEKLKLK